MVTRRETARAAKENLAAADVKILGAVLTITLFPSRNSLQKALTRHGEDKFVPSPSKRMLNGDQARTALHPESWQVSAGSVQLQNIQGNSRKPDEG